MCDSAAQPCHSAAPSFGMWQVSSRVCMGRLGFSCPREVLWSKLVSGVRLEDGRASYVPLLLLLPLRCPGLLVFAKVVVASVSLTPCPPASISCPQFKSDAGGKLWGKGHWKYVYNGRSPRGLCFSQGCGQHCSFFDPHSPDTFFSLLPRLFLYFLEESAFLYLLPSLFQQWSHSHTRIMNWWNVSCFWTWNALFSACVCVRERGGN